MGIIQFRKLGILLLVLICTNDQIFSLEHLNDQKGDKLIKPHKLLSKECSFLCEKLNEISKNYLIFLKNLTIDTTEQKSKNCAVLLNENIHSNKAKNIWKKFAGVYKSENLEISSVYFHETNTSKKLNDKNSTALLPSAACRNFINLIHGINRILRRFRKICYFSKSGCYENKATERYKQPVQNESVRSILENWQVGCNVIPWIKVMRSVTAFNKTKHFKIINEEPDLISIRFEESIKIDEVYLLYGSYANTTKPRFECTKILQQNFMVYVTPNVNYLICLVTLDKQVNKHYQVNFINCQPFKTKPLREKQPWLPKKSIPVIIMSIFVLFVLAMAMGASVLYLSVRKNPSLIRGSKRVIEVKRQDKAQILIMPRGYEGLPQEESPLALPFASEALQPAMSTLSCDTVSTVSYVSANQPTPVEILTYRLNRLKELFQRNNKSISPLVPSISIPVNQRLPPNMDLLLEYEWYTITTTITTETKTTTVEEAM